MLFELHLELFNVHLKHFNAHPKVFKLHLEVFDVHPEVFKLHLEVLDVHLKVFKFHRKVFNAHPQLLDVHLKVQRAFLFYICNEVKKHLPFLISGLILSQVLVLVGMFLWTENRGWVANLILSIVLILVGIVLWVITGDNITSMRELVDKVLWKITGGSIRGKNWWDEFKLPIIFILVGMFFIILGLGEVVFIMFIFTNLVMYAYLK